jgi:hypothetical protein
MVFTIVTILFLPMSFMASVFAINILEFPHDSIDDGGTDGTDGIHLSYVAKWMFGIAFCISLPLIIIAFFMSDTEGWVARLKNWLGRRKKMGKRATSVPRQGDAAVMVVDRDSDTGKARPSVEGWRYRPTIRVNTGGTDKSRRTQDIEAASPV